MTYCIAANQNQYKCLYIGEKIFDLTSGYHHVDIYKSFQTYLGFSWKLNNVVKYTVNGVTTCSLFDTLLTKPPFNKSKIAFSTKILFSNEDLLLGKQILGGQFNKGII
jgi:hypothetical protein